MSKRYDITGKIYGYLIVVKFSHIHKSPKGHTVSYWECLCNCGKIIKCSIGDLNRSGPNKSCGCYKGFYAKLAEDKKGAKSANLSGIGELPGSYFFMLKTNAKIKKRIFEITKEYVWDLFLKQNKKCALSGIDLKFNTKHSIYDGTASLDRIDSLKGYIEGNVQWVHKDINLMKW